MGETNLKLEQCENERQALKEANRILNERNEDLVDAVARLEQEKKEACDSLGNAMDRIGELEDHVSDLNGIVSLMEDGPGEPQGPLRVLSRDLINSKLTEVFGPVYQECQIRLFSDGDWVVPPRSDMSFYLDYFTMFWLPKLKPYTVIEVTRLDGTVVQIWARDCDDYADFLQGIPTMHLAWTPMPWGQFWGDVQGIVTGTHAFNWFITCTEEFDEVSINGLELWMIEPQRGQGWTVESAPGVTVYPVVGFIARPMSMFTVERIWMCKV